MSEFNQGFEEHGIGIEHFMPNPGAGDSVYIKRVSIPAGKVLHNHTHTFTHKSVLLAGSVMLKAGDSPARLIKAPVVLTIMSGVPHQVEALTDAEWLCIHATTETDPDNIDFSLVRED